MTVTTYIARRRLEMLPGTWREPEDVRNGIKGELVPEAHLWRRHENWLHAGYLREVEVTDEEFEAAMQEFQIPEHDREMIRERVGLSSTLGGPHATPFTSEPRPELPERREVSPSRLDGPVPARPDRRPVRPMAAPETKSTGKAPKSKLTTRKVPVLIPLRTLED